MTQTEYNVFLERLVPEYAADKVRIYLYTLRNHDQSVGTVWLGAAPDCPTECFLFDIYIDGFQRGKGYGTLAMRLIEEKARELRFEAIGLHVFGFNSVAIHLYEKMGYTTTHINMKKAIALP